MSTTAADTLGVVVARLCAAGYSFHSDSSDNLGCEGAVRQVHWFCWTDGKVDPVAGEDEAEYQLAVQAATVDFFVQAARNRAALVAISLEGPEVEPAHDFDDTEGAESYGLSMAAFEAAEIARRALRGEDAP